MSASLEPVPFAPRCLSLDLAWDWASAAVIARQWKVLEPVRAYGEWRGIPARMAYEQPPPNTRLLAASVAAIVWRNRGDTEAEYAHALASDAWEVVIPDLVYAP